MLTFLFTDKEIIYLLYGAFLSNMPVLGIKELIEVSQVALKR
jgi:hypothetical protein